MSGSSRFQRFLGELRRRHVPQTVAVYAVAAWAAIEFADVVVPNLGWPQGVVTAVIVAAAVGLPAVVVLAWVFDWGPEGIRRTPPAEDAAAEREAAVGRTGAGEPARSSYGPWLAAVVVLAVAIGSGVAVAMLTRDRPEEPAAEAEAPQTPSDRRAEQADPGASPPPEMVDPGYTDSVLGSVRDSLRDLPGMRGLDLDSIMDMALRFARTTDPAGPGAAIEILEPEPWRVGVGQPVAPGDTLSIRGIARDTRGVALVMVGSDTVARAPRREDPPTELPFGASLVGAPAHAREIAITVRTADGSEVRREFPLIRIPARP